MMDITTKVKELIKEKLNVDENEIVPAARFIEDLGADSLDTVELIMKFEEEFDMEIPETEADKLRTVQEAIDYIEKNLK
ncbi:MAG: acyl carrier protein [Candidatus Cloacimonetes bacterium]|nr:acyl carrier protein [Candidatus Cloacimonadota bacterium]